MKTTIVCTLGLGLLLMWQPRQLAAQQTTAPCNDRLDLYDGSRFQGQVEELRAGGDTVVFRLWSGVPLVVPRDKVRRIVQRCHSGKTQRPAYNFKETGLYHHTRAGALVGQSFGGGNTLGFYVQHSSGWMFSRNLGAGLGTGAEFFDPKGYDAASYPLFAEIRGYIFPRRITPYFCLGGGWGFVGKDSGERWGYIDNWKGGWMTQAEIGYRIGNHFSVHLGLRLQRKYREWTSVWGPESGFGTDRILHKRLMFGVGLLL